MLCSLFLRNAQVNPVSNCMRLDYFWPSDFTVPSHCSLHQSLYTVGRERRAWILTKLFPFHIPHFTGFLPPHSHPYRSYLTSRFTAALWDHMVNWTTEVIQAHDWSVLRQRAIKTGHQFLSITQQQYDSSKQRKLYVCQIVSSTEVFSSANSEWILKLILPLPPSIKSSALTINFCTTKLHMYQHFYKASDALLFPAYDNWKTV